MTHAGFSQMTMFAAIWTAISLSLLAAGAASAAGCRSVVFEDTSFSVCEAETGDEVRLFLRDDAGEILGTFDRLGAEVAADGREIVFAMNGGMYHPDRRPVGLYVENGIEEAGLVTREGPGNFGLLPNGVLCIAEDEISVVESRAFEADRTECSFASQSGPMLVIDGELHPRFLADSSSVFIRNGVGVTESGAFFAVISDEPVTFHRFGRFFRDVLGTPNALFIDGKVSRLFAPEYGRRDIGFPFGPMLVVTRGAD
ncbi:MAG: phosphodiester glycosidase family protein [Boseongicola sp.]|nr:phosphodiester glycosidase family protein [Boseongicola sp.]